MPSFETGPPMLADDHVDRKSHNAKAERQKIKMAKAILRCNIYPRKRKEMVGMIMCSGALESQ